LLEFLLAQGELAFPWGYLGYSLWTSPGRGLAAWVGVNGLSLLVLLVALSLRRRRWWPLLAWGALWLLPLPRPPADEGVLLVQGAVDPMEKWRGAEVLERYLDLTARGLSRHPEAGLVVWPETAVYRLPPELPPELARRDLLLGRFGPGPSNRAELYRGGELVGVYLKRRLVPFGETLPLGGLLGGVYRWFLGRMGLSGLAALRPGDDPRPLDGYAVSVCYEADFPGEVRRQVLLGGEVLVNLSNDGWFGAGFGREQHLAMVSFRAVENRRWLLRAANDGVTAVIDPYGRVVARLPVGEPAFLYSRFGRREEKTFYTRAGELPVISLAFTLTALGLITARARTPSPGGGRAGTSGRWGGGAPRRRSAAGARPRGSPGAG